MGTLFLDEIGDLPLELQPKLLRALQEKEIERLGGRRTIPVDVRLIAATNRDLAKMVKTGEFRSDLYYRLRVFPITIPPLRARTSDIPLLVHYFVNKHARRMNKPIHTIPKETMSALVAWPWPGNVRELENFIERAVILTPGSTLRAPLAELEKVEDESFRLICGPEFSCRRAGTHPSRAQGSKGDDRRKWRSGGEARAQADDIELQTEEAGHREKRLRLVVESHVSFQ